ncbi:MAG: ubiquinone/menaquinone biosynthesis methyltransferase [Elusimicrobia bacterium]|nr:ubiquinone/menaquinone biosynthesis methyltransferase [Elusimicrobiota bacterium]
MVSRDEIRRMFSLLAPDYDRFNFWSSLGMDRAWRRRLVGEVHQGKEARFLDIGAGTGDLAFLAAKCVQNRSSYVVGMDFSFEMLDRAKGRAVRKSERSQEPFWIQARAESLPFPQSSFDVVISAFVLRNLQRAGVVRESLQEACRVLRPSGRLLFLDLTRPQTRFLAWGHRLYLKTIVPLVGKVLFGPRWPGAYLESTIEELWPAERYQGLFRDAGFNEFSVKPLMGGVVSLFVGVKEC